MHVRGTVFRYYTCFSPIFLTFELVSYRIRSTLSINIQVLFVFSGLFYLTVCLIPYVSYVLVFPTVDLSPFLSWRSFFVFSIRKSSRQLRNDHMLLDPRGPSRACLPQRARLHPVRLLGNTDERLDYRASENSKQPRFTL